jgi:hypothetical protein
MEKTLSREEREAAMYLKYGRLCSVRAADSKADAKLRTGNGYMVFSRLRRPEVKAAMIGDADPFYVQKAQTGEAMGYLWRAMTAYERDAWTNLSSGVPIRSEYII